MSQAGPILFVSDAERPAFVAALDEARLFPVVDTNWTSAPRAVEEVQPAAVLAAVHAGHEPHVTRLAKTITAQSPYLPFVALDAAGTLPHNALPFSSRGGNPDRLIARLRAALRVRTLHATVLRRLPEVKIALPQGDPARDATVLLIGRGAAYPALSVAFGERVGVVGALSIEAAAKHLNTRDLDGVVLAEGFTARVTDAFLTVLAEDTRFRSLPVVVTAHQLTQSYDLPNLELITGEPPRIAANALPLIRQHAMEAQLSRTLRSIDAGGWLDPRSGLLTVEAFARDFAKAVEQTLARGGGLSVARFAFDPNNPRAQLDAARILSRLMRQMDFGAAQKDGSVIVVFAETDFRTAHMIARRLSAVMRHTSNGKHEMRSDPVVSVDSLSPSDTARSLLARLSAEASRAAS
ncbi:MULTISPECIES: GGDEF domain-containing protein [unclassified Bradyrhizobium]|uniref:GGDEF domain-containing protein n=1 Tax=Bradyrhizobium TaxID=374 RepID=UPI001CD63586|nr:MULTISPECIES: GGDEF domain-containing protein [unclassified Bradyrhizobium]MCA1378357.1 GGDEF domain-containing protein [Bradyrhizobium sp. IC4060]MCA1486818.1 GGDEF domain-containing protein [Bradyrhizobium sp. IC4061]MCA1540013.1 GGDEF domain-containing protein [Bradyrhizobium sp. NBAIM32]